jgi:hypothetical protein
MILASMESFRHGTPQKMKISIDFFFNFLQESFTYPGTHCIVCSNKNSLAVSHDYRDR